MCGHIPLPIGISLRVVECPRGWWSHLFVPAPPHASVLFFEGKPRAFSREVQWRFFEDEGSGETDADRKHERVQARGRNWRARGGYAMERRIARIKPTRPQHGN